MKQYLLSLYQPDGEPPAPTALEGIMAESTRSGPSSKRKARGRSAMGCTHPARQPCSVREARRW